MRSSKVRRVRRVVRVVASVVAVGAVVLVDAASADAAGMTAAVSTGASSAAAVVKPKPVATAPDLVSARVSARAQGARVEALSERTEFTTTWVNPDGTLTTEASTGRVRFRDMAQPGADGKGAWRGVDLSLREVAGQVTPVSSDLGVSFAGGGAAGDFVSVEHDNAARVGVTQAGAAAKAGTGRSVSWRWVGRPRV